jgi:hypothetical protein
LFVFGVPATRGLGGASTLAALQGFKATGGVNKSAEVKVVGPLVGYESDSEEDD